MAMINLLLSFLCIFTTTALSQPTSAPPYSQEPIDAASRSLLLLLQSPQPHHWLQSHPRLLSSLPSSSSETPTAPTISSGHWHAPTASPTAAISTRTSPLGGSAMAESQSIILILKILEHGSIRGLSILSFELELVGYTIALAYCLHGGLPFSAYGELAFLLIQALILVAIMYYYSQPVSIKRWMTALLYPSLLRKRRIRFLFFLMWKLIEMSNLPLSLGPQLSL